MNNAKYRPTMTLAQLKLIAKIIDKAILKELDTSKELEQLRSYLELFIYKIDNSYINASYNMSPPKPALLDSLGFGNNIEQLNKLSTNNAPTPLQVELDNKYLAGEMTPEQEKEYEQNFIPDTKRVNN